MNAPAPLYYQDREIAGILRRTKTIAMVGASANWVRPSNFAMKYLLGKGYKVIPVNPGHAGKEILGQLTYATLADVPAPIDMVDVFRGSDAAGNTIDETIQLAKYKQVQVIWLQLGVRNDEAAARAEASGITVIMDRCPKIEYGRLFGELGWSGVNSGIITAKRRRVGS
jgi:predicted CoA-binding protein